MSEEAKDGLLGGPATDASNALSVQQRLPSLRGQHRTATYIRANRDDESIVTYVPHGCGSNILVIFPAFSVVSHESLRSEGTRQICHTLERLANGGQLSAKRTQERHCERPSTAASFPPQLGPIFKSLANLAFEATLRRIIKRVAT
jgi:hypothetical protein